MINDKLVKFELLQRSDTGLVWTTHLPHLPSLWLSSASLSLNTLIEAQDSGNMLPALLPLLAVVTLFTLFALLLIVSNLTIGPSGVVDPTSIYNSFPYQHSKM